MLQQMINWLRLSTLENRNGGTVLLFILGVSIVSLMLVMSTMSLPQSNFRRAHRLYKEMNLANEIMEDLRTRVNCIGQQYNPDRAAHTIFTCTPGNPVNLYGLPLQSLFGTYFPTKIIAPPFTVLPSSHGRPVRAICLSGKDFRIELWESGTSTFKPIGVIDCP